MTDLKPERRSGQRIAARVPVSIKAGKGTTEATGFTRDLNAGGIFLYTDSRIVAGSELEMVCCRASVVRVEDGESGGDFGVAASIRSMEILPEIPS